MLNQLPPQPPIEGWWLDCPGDHVNLYHGTDSHNIHAIAQDGLLPVNSKCFLTACYETAANYSLFGPDGGDFAVIARRGPMHIYPPSRYGVVHFSVPKSFIEEHAIYPEYKGPLFVLSAMKCRLGDREIWENSDEPDSTFYLYAEISFQVPIPAEFVEGFSLPYVK